MNPISLEAKLIAIGIVVFAVIGGYFAWAKHVENKGYAKCEKADTTALENQIAELTKQRDKYRLQLENANGQLTVANARLDALAASPAVHLVCHAANREPLRSVPAQAPGELAAAGSVNAVPAGGFDPGPTIQRLSIAYERRVEQARDALNRWPTQ